MPTYQYACTACDERLEAVQKFTDDPLTECAVCGGRLRKLFSPVGIVFKGSGFYRTDSRNGAVVNGKDKSRDTASNGSGEAKPASSESSAGDSKTAAKAESSSAGSSSSGSGSSGSGSGSSGSGSSGVGTKVA